MIKLSQLEPWHVELLNSIGSIEPEIYTPDYSRYLCLSGPAVVLTVDGEVRGAGGVINLWEGVGEAWSLTTPWLLQHPLTMGKAYRKFFSAVCPDYRRVQITVEEDFEKAQAFAEFLGFTPEGRMPYYSPSGKTHIRYSRVDGWHQH